MESVRHRDHTSDVEAEQPVSPSLSKSVAEPAPTVRLDTPSAEPEPEQEAADLVQDSDADSVEDSDADSDADSAVQDSDAPEELKKLRAKVKTIKASYKRKLQQMQDDRKRLKILATERDEVRRLLSTLVDTDVPSPALLNQESTWRVVGEEVINSITVPCQMQVYRNNTCNLQCTEFYKDVLHALFGVHASPQPPTATDPKCAFKLLAARKRHGCGSR